MSEDDTGRYRSTDIGEALVLLSRLPVPASMIGEGTRGAQAAWAYPLAGAMIGAIAGLAGVLALGFGVTAGVAAAIVLITQIMLTGAMHEDGLADAADGLWGAQGRHERLEIMRDSRIGTYGVLALVLSVLTRWAALSVLAASGWLFLPVLAVAALSRAPMVAAMALMSTARDDGLSVKVGKPAREAAWLALGIGGAIALLLGGAGILATLMAAATAYAVSRIAQDKIGGQSGDILGAMQQVAEMAALATLTIWAL